MLWRFCWETEVDASPPPPPPPPAQNAGRLCVEWNTNYVDEGFGEIVTAPYRAAHAEYFLYLDSPSLTAPLVLGANPDPTGSLPPGSTPAADGCVPQADLDPNLLVHQPGHPTLDLELELRVRTLIEDPAPKRIPVRLERRQLGHRRTPTAAGLLKMCSKLRIDVTAAFKLGPLAAENVRPTDARSIGT